MGSGLNYWVQKEVMYIVDNCVELDGMCMWTKKMDGMTLLSPLSNYTISLA